MSNTMEKLQRILRDSKRYKMEGSILTLTHYYTGEAVQLDLSKMTEEALEELTPDEDEEEEEW